jgi:DNA-binding PadR family transcriptional regulator
MFFLLDKKIAEQIGGPHFDFQPYDYGPFDKEVYGQLAQLEETGFVEIGVSPGSNIRTYRLTNEGYQKGQQVLDELSQSAQSYISELARFVRSLSFAELVSAIYQEYPEMRANSVFVEVAQ